MNKMSIKVPIVGALFFAVLIGIASAGFTAAMGITSPLANIAIMALVICGTLIGATAAFADWQREDRVRMHNEMVQMRKELAKVSANHKALAIGWLAVPQSTRDWVMRDLACKYLQDANEQSPKEGEVPMVYPIS